MKFNVVFSSIYIGEVYFVKSLLDAADLKCEIIDENVNNIAPHLGIAVSGVKLIVPDSDLQEAKEIIKDYFDKQKSLKTQEITAPANQQKCPTCGNPDVSVSAFSNFWPSILVSWAVGLPIPFKKRYYHCYNCGSYWKLAK